MEIRGPTKCDRVGLAVNGNIMVKTNGHTNGKAIVKNEDEPLTITLAILNQRWTPHIVRCLLRRKMRFNEILRTIGMNPCTLRERLRDLEHWGIVDRNVISQMPPCVEYRLTAKGKDLRPIFKSMENWTRKWLEDPVDTEAPITVDES